MYRQPLTDSDGNPTARWFDRDTAIVYHAPTIQHPASGALVSAATGSPTEDEDLYHTTTGRWILCHRRYRTGDTPLERWEEIDEDLAIEWLARTGNTEAIPRPQPAGRIPARVVRVPDDIWSAAMRTGNASELVRRVLERWYRGECGQ